jgi:hypothetical protein
LLLLLLLLLWLLRSWWIRGTEGSAASTATSTSKGRGTTRVKAKHDGKEVCEENKKTLI